ncbi:MAG: helix-turn-helix transcriptional regulator [Clostridia bacterium]|nr:helix-turn-helix transcriptional regulator [Clostridia bacterium]
MTLGEKLTKLRKEKNYTQEQLADILNVSRQSISKWESDIAYPETDKLIKLGELYECSMDYLLKDKNQTQETPTLQNSFNLKSFHFERKSKKTIKGLPLYHINIGLGRTAKGVFAIGLCAKGIVSLGVFSLGIFSFGMFSLGFLAFGLVALGLLSFGTFSFGVISAGAISIGAISFGAVSVGLLSIGAVAIGEFSVGALSIGNYFAIGDEARAAIAIGKSEAVGTLYEATNITTKNRQEIINLLDQNVPTIFVWIKEIVKLFI